MANNALLILIGITFAYKGVFNDSVCEHVKKFVDNFIHRHNLSLGSISQLLSSCPIQCLVRYALVDCAIGR